MRERSLNGSLQHPNESLTLTEQAEMRRREGGRGEDGWSDGMGPEMDEGDR